MYAVFFTYSLKHVEYRFSLVEGYYGRREDDSVSGNKLQLIGIKIGKIIRNGGGRIPIEFPLSIQFTTFRSALILY